MSFGDPSSAPNPFSPNPYQAPPSAPGYMGPPPTPGADVPMILGIISVVLGVISVPLSCCVCIGIWPGALAIILGVVALVVPAQPGSPGKMLGIGGIVLGTIPFLWLVISFIIAAANPRPNNFNNDPFNIEAPAFPGGDKK